MDDFDIEMGDAVDVPMEEPQIEDIALGDDQQVSPSCISRENFVPRSDNLTCL